MLPLLPRAVSIRDGVIGPRAIKVLFGLDQRFSDDFSYDDDPPQFLRELRTEKRLDRIGLIG